MNINWADLEKKLVNFTDKNKRNDSILVTFFGLPENMANILGRQVKSVTRPTFEVQTYDTRFRGNTYKDKENITMTPISVAFYDDENSITTNILYMQLFRQLNKYPDKFGIEGKDRNYRFDMKVELFNAEREVTDAFIVKSCFIQSINHSDPDMADSADTEIVVMIEFDNVDIKVIDEFLSLK